MSFSHLTEICLDLSKSGLSPTQSSLSTSNIADEGIADPFRWASTECLRSVPVSGPVRRYHPRKANVAWVVFNGRETGIFGTWYVGLTFNDACPHKRQASC